MSELLAPGAQVAGYRIAGLLGQGGMGFVYEAEHAVLGRKAALKTLLPELVDDADFRTRFIAESQTVAALDHPSIIPIYDAGEADGVVYIAMRHVGGGDLHELLESGPLDPERAVTILEQVAAGLDAAHASDLVHRDVKPGNVLIESSGRVYLTDFGIAKRARSKGVTQTGFFVGTLDYAAPEQIRGESVGSPADIYALGCLLFECLTGRKPFSRETDVAVMHAHLQDPPPAASEARPELPPALDAVFAQALAKEEGARFGTCRELIEAARACLGATTSLPAATPASPTPSRRNEPAHAPYAADRPGDGACGAPRARLPPGRAPRHADRPGRHRQDTPCARGGRTPRSRARHGVLRRPRADLGAWDRRLGDRTDAGGGGVAGGAGRKRSRVDSATRPRCSSSTTSSRCCPRRPWCTSCWRLCPVSLCW